MPQIPPEYLESYSRLWSAWGSGLMIIVSFLALALVFGLLRSLLRGPAHWRCYHCGGEIHERDNGVFYPDGRAFCSISCERHWWSR